MFSLKNVTIFVPLNSMSMMLIDMRLYILAVKKIKLLLYSGLFEKFACFFWHIWLTDGLGVLIMFRSKSNYRQSHHAPFKQLILSDLSVKDVMCKLYSYCSVIQDLRRLT